MHGSEAYGNGRCSGHAIEVTPKPGLASSQPVAAALVQIGGNAYSALARCKTA